MNPADILPVLTGKERRIVRSFRRFCASRYLYKVMNILYTIFQW